MEQLNSFIVCAKETFEVIPLRVNEAKLGAD
jgi:hypothetical protein